MYCVCNGKELKIFRTDFAPEAALVKDFKYQAFETEFDNIANILSPTERNEQRLITKASGSAPANV
jgi:hypothetical protein